MPYKDPWRWRKSGETLRGIAAAIHIEIPGKTIEVISDVLKILSKCKKKSLRKFQKKSRWILDEILK